MTAERVNTGHLSITEAAYRAQKCERTIRAWLRRNKLTPYRVMGKLAVRTDELDALLARESTTADQPVAAVAN